MAQTRRIYATFPNSDISYLLKIDWRTEWEKAKGLETGEIPTATIIARAVHAHVVYLRSCNTIVTDK